MVTVTLVYPNGQRQEVLLAGVPREGEHIWRDNGPEEPSLVVEQVLWMEEKGSPGSPPDPGVVLVVRPHVNGPRVH